MDLASEGKQRAWWQPLGLPYSTYVGLEAEAASISDYGLAMMPGLLQTPDYARAVVQAAVPRWVPEVVEQRVEGRMTRQQILFSADAPRFETVVDESVLHRIVGVTLRVIRHDADALPAGNNKFIIVRFTLACHPRRRLHRGPGRRPRPRGTP